MARSTMYQIRLTPAPPPCSLEKKKEEEEKDKEVKRENTKREEGKDGRGLKELEEVKRRVRGPTRRRNRLDISCYN